MKADAAGKIWLKNAAVGVSLIDLFAGSLYKDTIVS